MRLWLDQAKRIPTAACLANDFDRATARCINLPGAINPRLAYGLITTYLRNRGNLVKVPRPPFDRIRGQMTLATVRGEVTASASYAEFQEMIRTLLVGIEVDEEWYLEQNPDIAEAIKAGIVQSAKQHFVYDGYFEGRRPSQSRSMRRFTLHNIPRWRRQFGKDV